MTEDMTFRDFLRKRIKEVGIEKIKDSLDGLGGPTNEEFFGKENAKIIEDEINRRFEERHHEQGR